MRRRQVSIVLAAVIVVAASAQIAVAVDCTGITPVAGTSIAAQLVAGGFSSPLYVTAPPGDVDRIFVVEQTGKIRIVESGVLLPTEFLDLSASISNGGEQGLLSMAFHPNYAGNGQFFVDYTDTGGNTVVSRFQVSGNPDVADTTETIILQQAQPFANHNGGLIKFGPGGYLYIALGDGGSGGDPFGNGQNTNTWLGKLLRIDVDSGSPYAVPPSNPFVGQMGYLPEIWALGLRNPWRYSFDQVTGDLYIGDVGQGDYEEVDFQPAASLGGENYGWNVMEGAHCYNPPSGCVTTGLTLPVTEYGHGANCSVTGGYVYRGCKMPDLHGRYFFADFCSSFIHSFTVSGGVASTIQNDSAALGGGTTINNISSFGEDARGELYMCELYAGNVYKIVPGPSAPVMAAIPAMPRWSLVTMIGLFLASFGWLVQSRSARG